MMWTVALAVGTSMHTLGTPLTVSVPSSSVIVSDRAVHGLDGRRPRSGRPSSRLWPATTW